MEKETFVEPLLTVDRFADLLSLKPATVRHWIKAGRIRAIKLGRNVLRIPTGELSRLKETGVPVKPQTGSE